MNVDERTRWWGGWAPAGIDTEAYLVRFLAVPPGLFAPIESSTREILCESLGGGLGPGSSWREVLAAIDATASVTVHRASPRFDELEVALVDLVERIGLGDRVVGMERPVNVRVAHGAAPEGYLDRRFPTDCWHSDLWAGEPDDIVNCVLYVAGDLASTHLEVAAATATVAEQVSEYRGDYRDADPALTSLPPVEVAPAPAQLVVFDGAVPHRTVRHGGGARVSIDFRLRRVDPYEVVDERWDGEVVPWSRYWYLNRGRARTATERLAAELEQLAAGGRVEGARRRRPAGGP